MDGCHPVLQVGLVAGLEGQKGTERLIGQANISHYEVDSDVTADKSASTANVWLLCYLVIYHSEITGWEAGPRWINK